MTRISLEQIVTKLRDELNISKDNNKVILKSDFRRAMASSGLFTSRDSINIRWEQLYGHLEILQQRGKHHRTGEPYVVLDMVAVEKFLFVQYKPTDRRECVGVGGCVDSQKTKEESQ